MEINMNKMNFIFYDKFYGFVFREKLYKFVESIVLLLFSVSDVDIVLLYL